MDRPALPALELDADFWSLRFVDESCESLCGAQERRPAVRASPPTAARWPPSTRTAATATRRPATSRTPGLRDALRARGRAGRGRRRAARCSIRGRCPGPRRAATTRRPSLDAAAAVAARMVRAAAPRNRARRRPIRASSTGKRCVDVRACDAPARHERRRRRRPALPLPVCRRLAVTAHADGDTQTRTLNGYRGICQQGGDEILGAVRLRRRRRGASPTRRSSCSPRRTARAARWTCC